jgi:hypothetical protein
MENDKNGMENENPDKSGFELGIEAPSCSA